MILLIDAGNTRIKWGLVGADRWIAEGLIEHAEIASLRTIAGAHPGVRRVLCANVAGDRIAAGITEALRGTTPPPEWLRASAECCGVRNLYASPSQLGVDRWAALIGARALHCGPCLVVTAGTATTIDLLDETGCFQGGLILPGDALMRRALASNTAQLPFAEGRFELAPRCTADAIVSGCLNAQAGAIERMFRQIERTENAVCVLSGGAAGPIRSLLSMPIRSVDNLVLKGLAAIAGALPSS